MISWNYFANLFRTHRVLLATSFVFVGLFQILMLMLFETFDLPSLIQEVVQRMPLPAQQLFGEQFVTQFTLGGAVAFGYNHPLILVTLLLVAISVPVRHIAGAIEGGSLELVLAMPVSRLRIALSLWIGAAAFLLLIVAGCWLGTGVGRVIFPETRELSFRTVGTLGLNLWTLALTVTSYALLLSVTVREASRAAQLAAGFTIFFFFLDLAAQIWPAIDFLTPITPFNYYGPQEIVRGESGWIVDLVVLASAALILGVLGLIRFQRRDVP